MGEKTKARIGKKKERVVEVKSHLRSVPGRKRKIRVQAHERVVY